MTDALFDLVAMPAPHAGPLRKALDGKITEATEAEIPVDADLIVVTRALADRIDSAIAARAYRGFVMLTAEYRSARRDLFEHVAGDAGDDGFAAALAEFEASERAASSGHPEGPVTAD